MHGTTCVSSPNRKKQAFKLLYDKICMVWCAFYLCILLFVSLLNVLCTSFNSVPNSLQIQDPQAVCLHGETELQMDDDS